jgi:protein TonB
MALFGAVLVSQFSPEPSDAVPAGATVINVMTMPELPPAAPPMPRPPALERPNPKPKPKSELPPLAPARETPLSEASLVVYEHAPESASLSLPAEPVTDVTDTLSDAVPFTAAVSESQQAAPVEGNAPGPTSDTPTWEGMVLAALERQKRYPTASQRRREQDVVYVRITLDREGRVVASRIHKSQNYAALDAEALDLVRRASPLPKPPESVNGERVDLVVPIEFFLSRARR